MGFNSAEFGLEPSDVVGFTADQRTAVEMQMCIAITNEGTLQSKNFRYPRFESFYGYAQIMAGAYVARSVNLRTINQEILWWRDESVGINETTGCYAKGLASLFPVPVNLVTNTILTRQRYTSVRFRLLPLVQANITLNWETFDAKCGGNVLNPDQRQGEPTTPNNNSSNPANRPSGQGGDNADRSANDGNYDPTAGLPREPKAANTNGGSCWHYFGQIKFLPSCDAVSYTGKLATATDPRTVPIYVDNGANTACPGSRNLLIKYKGETVDDPSAVVGGLQFSFY